MPGPVLIVEDAHDTRVALRELLEDEGYAVTTACTGVDALAMMRAVRPALALVDYRLPIMDGGELAQVVRSDPALADVPLIFVTAYEPDPGLRALVDGFVKKPPSRAQLLRIVERFAGRSTA